MPEDTGDAHDTIGCRLTALAAITIGGSHALRTIRFERERGRSTLASNGSIDRRNAFFRPLGKQYAVTCEHCHFASDGSGVSVEHILSTVQHDAGQASDLLCAFRERLSCRADTRQ